MGSTLSNLVTKSFASEDIPAYWRINSIPSWNRNYPSGALHGVLRARDLLELGLLIAVGERVTPGENYIQQNPRHPEVHSLAIRDALQYFGSHVLECADEVIERVVITYGGTSEIIHSYVTMTGI